MSHDEPVWKQNPKDNRYRRPTNQLKWNIQGLACELTAYRHTETLPSQWGRGGGSTVKTLTGHEKITLWWPPTLQTNRVSTFRPRRQPEHLRVSTVKPLLRSTGLAGRDGSDTVIETTRLHLHNTNVTSATSHTHTSCLLLKKRTASKVQPVQCVRVYAVR